MGIEKIKNEIKNCESIISKNQTLLNEIRKNITEVAKPFVKEKLQSFVEREVKEQSGHTKSLSIDELKEMKRKLMALLNESDNLTLDKLANDSYWMHINYNCENKDDIFYSHNSREEETKITSAFQELFGYAGKILNDYKYIKVGNDYNNHSSSWVFISGSGGKIR